MKARAAAEGRDPDHLLIFPGINPIVGRTDTEAEEKYRAMTELVTIDEALRMMSQPFSYHDFSQYELDAPFPEISDLGENLYLSTTNQIKQNARDRGLTLRQAALEFATPRSDFIGSAEHVANAVVRWFEAGAGDGFMLVCRLDGAFEAFLDDVVPILQARGLFRRNYEAATLRGNLGLPVPQNRHTARRGEPISDLVQTGG
ncbi:LLM class flavin-dependent oxidoreductase [Sphingopyxis sp.]|uniref:LLM class flavin-dependent oxidoreductase n=1 Tax=Sphingopyxis sp. TaxID=1908224 RepID=UPI00345A24E9